MADQYPILILVSPFLLSFAVAIGGYFNKRVCWPITVAALAFSLFCGLQIALRVAALNGAPLVYELGNWPAPVGIVYSIDALNALVLVVIPLVGLLAAFYARRSVEKELSDKLPLYYTLYLLLITGLTGMTLTGDAFNLYVLLEITALTGYALIAVGKGRAALSTFNYIIMGTIGASFYLLGVGYLYIKTGSLNMADIRRILVEQGLYGSETVMIAFIMIMVGLWVKMALFPLHGWLPNAYTHAPNASSVVIAPLVTKVTVYIMIRMMMSVFSPAYAFQNLDWSRAVVWLAIIAILAGSVYALSQRDLKRLLTYLIVAEVGYMVGGVWLANRMGLTGAIFHIASDALMTLCLFLAVAIILYQTGHFELTSVRGLYKKMPFTMAGFTVGALSMIGIPPTCGFFSKWYLISGGIQAGQWGYVVALLLSSLVNAVVFFRIIEFAHFGTEADLAAAGHHGHSGNPGIREAPLSMVIPLLIVGVLILLLGIYSGRVVEFIGLFVNRLGLS
ncbi:MAG: monovalent cation/H+ antiporter subunit D family protein [Calditrichaeota bacterium]|nr:MAG: monovalent cation/H+ antiporter subunit D family protein [Calditrichota bacterium]